MPGARELLQLIIQADAAQAIREVDKLGKTADRELGKAQRRSEQWATGLTRGGAAAVGFAAVAGTALVGFAKQSEQAERSNLLLQNTLDNMPKLAGENKRAFIDVADAIARKTVVDNDSVVAAEALLGTFKVTGQEIRNLTPLVVDYARKFDTDLNSAAIQVGKALDGQVGALKRNGVSIDETLFKTDRYAAVQQALAQQVGGFAENEGKTFSGQLKILQNQLGDVAEGIGGGVVSAMRNLIGPLTAVSDKFSDLSPATQESVGKIAAFATAGLGAVGATSVVAGQLIKLRSRFQEIDTTTGLATGKLNTFGKAAGVLAGAAAIGGAVIALKALNDESGKVSVNIEKVSALTDQKLVEGFKKLANIEGPFGEINKEMETFQGIAEGNIATAQRLVDGLKAEGVNTDAFEQALQKQIKAQQQSNRDMQASTGLIDENSDAAEEAKSWSEANAEALDAWSKKQKDAEDAARGHTEALFGFRDAARDMEQAQFDLTDQVAAFDAVARTSAAGTREYAVAENEAEAAIDAVAERARTAAEEQATLSGKQLDAAGAATAQRSALEQLRDAIAPNSPLRAYLEGLIADLDRAAQPRNATFNMDFRGDPSSTVSRKLPPRMAGGPVGAYEAYTVGENGPEALVMGSRGGFVVPNGGGGGGGTTVLQLVVDGKVLGQAVVDQSNRSGGLAIRLRPAS